MGVGVESFRNPSSGSPLCRRVTFWRMICGNNCFDVNELLPMGQDRGRRIVGVVDGLGVSKCPSSRLCSSSLLSQTN